MVENNGALLSICIPTYNRAKVIEQTLLQITSDIDFDDEVELIISDNCSTDNTREVVLKFVDKFENVHYYCNNTNIKDENFSKVLMLGNGLYLKLQNDNLAFKSGGLKFMKDKLKENLSSRIPVFFTGDRIYTRRKKNEIRCNSLDEYVQSISTYVTYISCFGDWKSSFENLEDKNRHTSLLLAQVDWSYRIVSTAGKCVIYDNDIYLGVPVSLGIRKGYNYFDVQVDNYYKIMKPYVEKSVISKSTYLKDRQYSLKHFKRQLYFTYIWHDKYFQFETSDTKRVLWKYYRDIPLFYFYILSYPFCFLFIPFYYRKSIRSERKLAR